MRASVVRDSKLTAHPCGVHPQAIPRDSITGLSAIPYDSAEDLGYLKVDFLHLSLLGKVASNEEVRTLSRLDPNWTLLQLPSTWPKLFQLSKHGEMLTLLKPKSIQDLADAMALIRPGKKALLGLYVKSRAEAQRALYAKDEKTGYSFKRSHALAYSLNVVIQLHLIEQGRL